MRTAIANRIANRKQRIANRGIRTLSRVCKLEAKYTKRENFSRRLAATAGHGVPSNARALQSGGLFRPPDLEEAQRL